MFLIIKKGNHISVYHAIARMSYAHTCTVGLNIRGKTAQIIHFEYFCSFYTRYNAQERKCLWQNQNYG